MPKKKAPKKVAISYTDEDRRKIVEIWRKSGLTQRQFCKGLNLHPCTLSEWSSRFRKSQRDKVKKAAFVPGHCEARNGGLLSPLPGAPGNRSTFIPGVVPCESRLQAASSSRFPRPSRSPRCEI